MIFFEINYFLILILYVTRYRYIFAMIIIKNDTNENFALRAWISTSLEYNIRADSCKSSAQLIFLIWFDIKLYKISLSGLTLTLLYFSILCKSIIKKKVWNHLVLPKNWHYRDFNFWYTFDMCYNFEISTW